MLVLTVGVKYDTSSFMTYVKASLNRELRLKEFRNFYANDIDGNCCQPQDRFGSSCVGRCDTKFRICLKHYQKEVALGQGCTFGEEITPVLGSNNLTIHRPPIKFDINFKWPVGFTN